MDAIVPPRPSTSAPRGAAALVALCCAVYFTSYLTRKGYDASILAIGDATGIARSSLSYASTAAVALYGSGQFATGLLADRFDPRRIILLALLLTASCNLAMPVAMGCIPAMVALWAVNGFAQAMFWPPLVKIVATNLPPDRYRGAVFWISVASNAAIVAVFVLVSGCIRLSGWRLSFRVVTACALAMAALWAAAARRLAPVRGTPGRASQEAAAAAGAATPRAPFLRLLVVSGLFPILAIITCQGILRDGIEVWSSSIIKDQYGLGTSGSILSVAVLPVFGVASMAVARALRRALGDEVLSAMALFGSAFACAAVLFATRGASLAVGLPLLAVLSASMHGANLMLIGELPGRFASHGRVGTISGLLNAFTYVGAAISIYGFPALNERFHSWRPVFALWMGVIALAIALFLLALRRWLPFAHEPETTVPSTPHAPSP